MKKYIHILATFLICNHVWAQPTFTWAKAMGGTYYDYGLSIALDASGNVYTTGIFYGTIDFDPGAGTFNLTSTGNADIFISKLDAAGNFVWAKAMGGSAPDDGYSIALDGSGNVYTTGFFEGTADFDPGAGVANLTSAGSSDIFISKLDASGNFVWSKSMGGAVPDYGYSIALDASGNVFTTGFFSDTADFNPGAGTFNLTSAGDYDIFISKLDAAGNFVWAKKMGGTTDDWSLSIALDASGNVYTTGYFYGTFDFDPGAGTFNLTSAGSQDIFISKLDAAGNFVWAKAMGGAMGDIGYSIALDASGNVFTTGSFSDTADFNPGAGTFNLTSAGYSNIFISKLDAAGNFVWAKKMGVTTNAGGKSIALDAYGNVFTMGGFVGTADFDPGAGTFNLTSAGVADIFISKLNAAGNFVWAKKMGGTTDDVGYSIALDASGNVYTTGYFYGTADFDPGAGTFNLTSAGNNDIFVHKMADCLAPPTVTATSSAASVCTGGSVTLNGGGASTYTWDNNVIDAVSFVPTATTTYMVTGTDVNGCSNTATTTVTVNQIPFVTATSTAAVVCAGASVTLTGSGATTYAWMPGNLTGATVVVSPSSTTAYMVTGTDANGCVNTSTTTVTVNPLPILTLLASSQVYCVSDPAGSFSASPTGGVWTGPGVTGNSFDPSVSGFGLHTVVYTYTDNNSCTNTASLLMTVNACVGINEIANGNLFSVFPNPATNEINVKANASLLGTAYTVFDNVGKVVLTGKIISENTIIELGNLSSGVYMLNIGDNLKQTFKVIKE